MFIACSTYNRPLLTRLCLQQQIEAADGAGRFHVWDDGSDDPPDFSGLDLESLINCGENTGPHFMRIKHIGAFLDSGEDILYLTDSDAILDPEALDKGRKLLESEGDRFPIICLYNSLFHRRFTVGSGMAVHGEIVLARAFAPGISMMIHRASLEPVAPHIPFLLTREWDFALPRLLEKPCLVTITSYVEHLGAGGVHSKPDDWERDRAINPTMYLVRKRADIISQL